MGGGGLERTHPIPLLKFFLLPTFYLKKYIIESRSVSQFVWTVSQLIFYSVSHIYLTPKCHLFNQRHLLLRHLFIFYFSFRSILLFIYFFFFVITTHMHVPFVRNCVFFRCLFIFFSLLNLLYLTPWHTKAQISIFICITKCLL